MDGGSVYRGRTVEGCSAEDIPTGYLSLNTLLFCVSPSYCGKALFDATIRVGTWQVLVNCRNSGRSLKALLSSSLTVQLYRRR